MANFPALPSGSLPDSSKFSVTLVDNTKSQETEGGYEYTRPRTTRRLRKSFSVGYTFIDEADRLVIRDFYELTAKGGAVAFQWANPQDNQIYTVRFKGDVTFNYVGIGTNQRWDCSFELKQV